MKTCKTILSLLALTALISGCATSGYQKANHTAASLQSTSDCINKGTGQIDAALASLSQLVDNPSADLKAQLKTFDSSVSGVESMSREIGSRVASTQQQGAEYFQKWDEDMAQIQNTDIRSNSADRKEAVVKQFDRVKASYESTRGQLMPFVADLRDIRTALSTDLTPAGVEAIRGAASKANAKGVVVRQSLSELAVQYKDLSASLRASAPQPIK
jgi:hypothetical protein